jgi:opacity protein-like surface antigen
MMRDRSLSTAVLAFLLILPGLALAQREYGDGFAIGGVLLPSGSPQLLGSTRLGETTGIEFGLGFDVRDDDRGSQTDLEAGIGIKLFVSDRNQFQPFVGGRLGVRHSSWDDGGRDGEDTRFGATGFLGGEYFITRKLSVEGELELSLFFGSVELATGSRFAAFFYL